VTLLLDPVAAAIWNQKSRASRTAKTGLGREEGLDSRFAGKTLFDQHS